MYILNFCGGIWHLARSQTVAKRRIPPALHHHEPAAVLTTAGARYLLLAQVGAGVYTGLVCHLYVNAYSPVDNSNIGNFTECVLAGYAPVTLVGNDWVEVSGPPEATIAYPTLFFVFAPYSSAAVTVYGFYVTNGTGNLVVWAEEFAVSAPIPALGATLPLDLVWNDRGEE
jgi:hypothetical protein